MAGTWCVFSKPKTLQLTKVTGPEEASGEGWLPDRADHQEDTNCELS